MDLKDLQPSTREVEIKHPGTGENVGVRVSLVSINDPSLAKIKRSIQDERIRLERKGKSFKASDLEENGLNIAFASMKSWDWYGDGVMFNGEKPEFNRKNVFEVFKSIPWFKDQIDLEMGDDSSFFTI